MHFHPQSVQALAAEVQQWRDRLGPYSTVVELTGNLAEFSLQARSELELSLTPHSQEPVASSLRGAAKALRLHELLGPNSIGVTMDGVPLGLGDQVGGLSV